MSDANQLLDSIAAEVLRRVAEKIPEILPSAKLVVKLETAADMLDCTTQHVKNLVAAGVLTPVQWSNGKKPRPYFAVDDLRAAVARAKRKPAA